MRLTADTTRTMSEVDGAELANRGWTHAVGGVEVAVDVEAKGVAEEEEEGGGGAAAAEAMAGRVADAWTAAGVVVAWAAANADRGHDDSCARECSDLAVRTAKCWPVPPRLHRLDLPDALWPIARLAAAAILAYWAAAALAEHDRALAVAALAAAAALLVAPWAAVFVSFFIFQSTDSRGLQATQCAPPVCFTYFYIATWLSVVVAAAAGFANALLVLVHQGGAAELPMSSLGASRGSSVLESASLLAACGYDADRFGERDTHLGLALCLVGASTLAFELFGSILCAGMLGAHLLLRRPARLRRVHVAPTSAQRLPVPLYTL